MDMQNLKDAMETIEMPASMQERIKQNCILNRTSEKEEYPMKHHARPLKRTALIAAALILCLPVMGLAVSNSGMFRDVKNIFGTVIRTEYENATDEIAVSLSAEEEYLLVETTFVNPDTAPYNACEMLAIGTYQILDDTGNVILKGEETQPETITDGKAVFRLPLESLKKGSCTLEIDSFISSKKADQPLPIHGNWRIPFSI